LDYDPFLNAQDCDLEGLKTLEIKKDLGNDSWFTVTYISSHAGKSIMIRLKIITVDNSYCIYGIGSLD
jgi:hypothetical protein